jgi:hypothetical protein
MATRRGWDLLSEKYRSRLVKGGMTKARYEAGESLKAARGHKATPENKRELEKHPEKFEQYRERQKKYREERKRLVDRVVEKKRLAYQYSVKFSEENSRDFVKNPKVMARKQGVDFKKPTVKQLRMVDAMSLEDLIDYQYEVKMEDDWRFLWYH